MTFLSSFVPFTNKNLPFSSCEVLLTSNCDQETNEDENDENIKGIWESDDEDITEQNNTDEHMDTDNKEETPPHETKPAGTTEKPEPKQKTKRKSQKTTPNQRSNPSKEKTPKPNQQQTPKPTGSDPSNQSEDISSPAEQNPRKQTESKQDQPTATKRKLPTNSSQVDQKKTKDITSANKDSTHKEPTVIINGKACVQRNLDFSGSQQKTKIPVRKQVRTGRTPGNRGTKSETRPRPRSRSRHRESGSVEGRGKDSC